jgi:hypothetical protein
MFRVPANASLWTAQSESVFLLAKIEPPSVEGFSDGAWAQFSFAASWGNRSGCLSGAFCLAWDQQK